MGSGSRGAGCVVLHRAKGEPAVLKKTFRHIARYREVAGVLAKYGLYDLLERLGLARFIPGAQRPTTSEKMLPETLRRTVEELGPTYIKLAQILSTRPDLVPEEYLVELEKLQDTAPSVPFAEVAVVIETEFGRPINRTFAQFEEEPLAAASLGQVHRAMLQDGSLVVVKIQRPGIREVIETDLEILFSFARALEAHFERARIYSLIELVEEFSVTLRAELDYTREGRNTDHLRADMKDERGVKLPAVHWDYTTPKVLTLERIDGVKITDIEGLLRFGDDPKKVAANLARAFLKQIFVDGFFHGDPHPGNLLVLPGNEVVLLDSGMVGRLDVGIRNAVVNLLSTFLTQNSKEFANELLNIGSAPDSINRRQFVRDIDRGLRQYYDVPSREVSLGVLLRQTLDITFSYRVILPSSFAMLVKVFIDIDGIARQLDSEFNFTEAARPFLTKAMQKQFSWEETSSELYRTLAELRALILSLPNRVTTLLDKAVEGTFAIEFKHVGLDEFSRNFSKAVNRLSFSFLVGALIIGSSIVIQSHVGPMFRGYAVLGVGGFLIAGVLGLWLLFSFLRAGSLW